MKYLQNQSSHQNNIKPVLSCQSLCVDYYGLRAIDNVTGDFFGGTMTAIIGPNGGGKSTLLKAFKGFIQPTAGSIKTYNTPVTQIAYLPQSPTIDRSFPINVGDVVSMGLCQDIGFFRSISVRHKKRIEQALASVGMEKCYNRPISTLSGGQFQRILFARIALQDASIILLDEPFAAIDSPTMEILSRVLQAWQAQGKTIIAVLHDIDVVREFFPHSLLLARNVVGWGATSDVLTLETLREAKSQCASRDSDHINLTETPAKAMRLVNV